jgi:hypothetical protein
VPSLGRLKQHNFDLMLGHRAVLNSARNDDKISLAERDALIAEIYSEAASQDQEELVLPSMVCQTNSP